MKDPSVRTKIGEPKILLLESLGSSDRNIKTAYESYGGVARRRRWYDFDRWLGFLTIVILPSICGALYFGWYAADRYISRAAFVVKYAEQQPIGDISSLLGANSTALPPAASSGLEFGNSDSHIVSAYILSTAGMEKANEIVNLRKLYQRREADLISKYDAFGIASTNYDLHRYYKKMTKVEFDPATSITTVSVQAFRPEDAADILTAQLLTAEKLVNGINKRIERSAVELSEERLKQARDALLVIEQQLIEFRERHTMLNPVEISAAISITIAELIAKRAELQGEIDYLVRVAPENENLGLLRSRVTAIGEQIKRERESLAGPGGELTPALVEFERLVARREVASQIYIAATQRYENAKYSELEQRVFIERIYEPTKPDYAEKPDRTLNSLAVLLLSLCLFSLIRVFIRDSRMHHGR